MPKKKLYAQRETDELDMYLDHVLAMTAEDLNNKSAIAGELAFRDHKIAQLEAHAGPDEVDRFAANLERLAEQVPLPRDPLRKAALIYAAGLAREYAKRARALS